MAKCKRNIIISLFDLTGSWSMPYRQAGYIVAQIDIFFGIDILIWNYKAIQQNKVHGIIAAPPCTHFTKVSSRFWKDYDSNGKTNYSLSLIDKTLEIIEYFNPDFWVLEQSVGRLSSFRPNLTRQKLMTFSPEMYGDPISKKTILYGQFNPFLSEKNTHSEYRYYIKDSKNKKSITSFYNKIYPGLTRSQLRSTTSPEFAKAFYNANP